MINVVDGRRLGHIVDIVFDLVSARLLGLVVPGEKSFWNVFKNGNQLFIPFSCVCKIGDDTILVELHSSNQPQNPYILSGPKKDDK